MGVLLLNRDAESSRKVEPWLTIVGIGEDGRAGLSAAAIAAIENASVVIGGARHLDLSRPKDAETLLWKSPITQSYQDILARRGIPTCILASGDPFYFGVGAELARLIPADEILCFPQVSSFSLAAARLGWSIPECACLSLHGRSLERVIPHLQPGARILALSWDGSTPAHLAALLCDRGMGGSRLSVLEAMGGERERMQHMRADSFALDSVDPLNVVALDIVAAPDARIVSLSPGLADSLYENDGQLTKADIRAITLAALAPRAGELLWDVGAGAGSISIEWMLRHERNRAIAIESNPERVERIARNAAVLGTPDLVVMAGHAPGMLRDLPAPDAIFIGGGASRDGVFDACWNALKSGGRLVVNAVTLETERMILERHERHGGTLKRIAMSHLEPVGSLQGWRPAMPVTQWSVTKP